MLRQVASLGASRLAFIAPRGCFDDLQAPWDQPMEHCGQRFRCPTQAEFDAVSKHLLPDELLEELTQRDRSSQESFRILLTEVHPPLRRALCGVLRELTTSGTVRAVLSAWPLPSLSAAAAEFGLPVIHNGPGPFRPPHYQGTVHFDFTGVDGRTNATDEMAQFVRNAPRWSGFNPLQLEEIRALHYLGKPPVAAEPAPEFEVGVALQIEDDSTPPVCANGMTGLEVLRAAREGRSVGKVLVRRHPITGREDFGAFGVLDDSPDFVAFLHRCRSLHVLGSSPAFEALLWGKPVTIYGDCAASELSAERTRGFPPDVLLLKLNYLLLCHLVPAELQFDPAYIEWRLGNPSLREIYGRHLAFLAAATGNQTFPTHPLQTQAAPATSAHGSPTGEPDTCPLGDPTQTRAADGVGRVLFVSSDASRSGAPILLLHLLRWLKAHTRLQFRVLLREGGPLLAEFQAVAETWLGSEMKDTGSVLDQVDLVCSNTCANGVWLEELVGNSIPIITHARELDCALDGLAPETLAAARQHSHHFIACSEAVRENLEGRHGVRPEAIDLIYEWVPVDELMARAAVGSPTSFRAEHGLDEETFVVAACGGAQWRKGADLFVQTAERLRRRLAGETEVVFLWVGPVPSDERGRILRHDVERLGLGGVVRFVGEQENACAWLNCCDVFCLTSREDPFPVAMLEAGALGKPVICFERSGGAVEYCASGGGFAVPYLDADLMAQRILGFIRNRPLLREIGRAGARLVRERFDVEVAGQAVLGLLQRVGAAARRPSTGGKNRTNAAGATRPGTGLDWAGVERLCATGELEQVERLLRAEVAAGRVTPEVVLGLGNLTLEKGDLSEAHHHLLWATALAPESVFAHLNLGQVLVRMGRLPAAEGALRRVLDLDPNHPAALRTLATLCFDGCRLTDAIGLFETLLRCAPGDPEALLGLARCRLAQHHYTLAELLCEEALERRPGDEDVKATLAAVRKALQEEAPQST